MQLQAAKYVQDPSPWTAINATSFFDPWSEWVVPPAPTDFSRTFRHWLHEGSVSLGVSSMQHKALPVLTSGFNPMDCDVIFRLEYSMESKS